MSAQYCGHHLPYLEEPAAPFQKFPLPPDPTPNVPRSPTQPVRYHHYHYVLYYIYRFNVSLTKTVCCGIYVEAAHQSLCAKA